MGKSKRQQCERADYARPDKPVIFDVVKQMSSCQPKDLFSTCLYYINQISQAATLT